MARKPPQESSFGSDSFLDVVANIVGILIILIVVAGVRVAKAPRLAAGPPATAPLIAAASIAALPAHAPPPAPLPEPEPPVVLPALPELSVPDELVREATRHAERLALAREELSVLNEQQRSLRSRSSDIALETQQHREALGARAQTLADQRRQLDFVRQRNAQAQLAVQQLEAQVAMTEADGPPVEKLTHRLPPVGRIVTGKEIHFRLMNNRVSHVPLMQLAELVQKDMERRKEILLSRPQFQGRTDALGGYCMEYVMERQAMSLAEELKIGRGMIRIMVSGWVIQPTGELITETPAQALTPGSRFQSQLLQAGPESTVTFWVYPDSFEIHRELKQLAHESGYWVAARPLPEGVPIAGSPEGSKSFAQ